MVAVCLLTLIFKMAALCLRLLFSRVDHVSLELLYDVDAQYGVALFTFIIRSIGTEVAL